MEENPYGTLMKIEGIPEEPYLDIPSETGKRKRAATQSSNRGGSHARSRQPSAGPSNMDLHNPLGGGMSVFPVEIKAEYQEQYAAVPGSSRAISGAPHRARADSAALHASSAYGPVDQDEYLAQVRSVFSRAMRNMLNSRDPGVNQHRRTG